VASHSGQFFPKRLPVNCQTHCVSRDWTHSNQIVSPTRYQCYRDHYKTIWQFKRRFPYYHNPFVWVMVIWDHSASWLFLISALEMFLLIYRSTSLTPITSAMLCYVMLYTYTQVSKQPAKKLRPSASAWQPSSWSLSYLSWFPFPFLLFISFSLWCV